MANRFKKKKLNPNNNNYAYVYVDLEKLERVLNSYRRQREAPNENSILALKDIPYDDPAISSDDDDRTPTKNSTKPGSKKNWFSNSVNTYDHIKVNPDAPEFKDFMPQQAENGSQWWFYNQADHTILKDERKHLPP